MFCLIEISPLLVTDGSRPVLRACNAEDRRLVGASGLRWLPAVTKAPSLGLKLFDGDFTSDVDPGSAEFTVKLDTLALSGVDISACRWAGAAVTIRAVPSTAPVYVTSGGARVIDDLGNIVIDDLDVETVFAGLIDSFQIQGAALQITAKVDTTPFDVNVLTATYAGTGGVEGGADLKDKPKPWVLGRALNVAPVMIDQINSVLQFSAYGPIEAVNALYERGSSFGPSVGDFADYDALVAADVPAGRWGTCLAQGMVRLGAPPYGVITGDVDGDHPADGEWLRLTGAIIRRVALNAGVDPALIDAASFDALDAAVPYPVNIVLSEQESVIDLAKRMIRPCNAQCGVAWLGQLFATRIAFGASALTLDCQGRRRPVVKEASETDVSPPYKRIQMGAAQCWRVQSFDEIAFYAELVDRGSYDPAETYREGNIVRLNDGSSWLYVNPVASAGHDPQEEGSVYWSSLAGRIDGPRMSYVEPIEVQADTKGVILDGQLPVLRAPARFLGDDDVSDSTAWAVSATNGLTVEINNVEGDDDRGLVTLSDLTVASGSITVTSTRDGLSISQTFSVQRLDTAQAASSTPSAPGTPASTNVFTAIAGSTSHIPISSVLSVQVGDSGEVDLSANLDCTIAYSGAFLEQEFDDVADTATAAAKWQYSADGSTGWTDVGTEAVGNNGWYYTSASVPKGVRKQDSYVSCSRSQTGLTGGETAYFRLTGRRSFGGRAISGETGTATATPV